MCKATVRKIGANELSSVVANGFGGDSGLRRVERFRIRHIWIRHPGLRDGGLTVNLRIEVETLPASLRASASAINRVDTKMH
jgi:hypothetical protein